jgi:hypothetical protein
MNKKIFTGTLVLAMIFIFSSLAPAQALKDYQKVAYGCQTARE